MDIVIYTTRETMLHKRGIGEPMICEMFYWQFKRMPRNVEMYDRVYFACQGAVIGSFEIDFVHEDIPGGGNSHS